MDVHNGGINGCYHLVCAANGDVSVSGLLLSLLMLGLFRGIYKIMAIIIISKSSIFIYPKMFMNPDFKLCLFRFIPCWYASMLLLAIISSGHLFLAISIICYPF